MTTAKLDAINLTCTRVHNADLCFRSEMSIHSETYAKELMTCLQHPSYVFLNISE
ncbi:hypothetical protein [Nostoc sp. CALU 546]|uniref:hypothetical protein n=1 Tax=Nostoc sp. CALU 546 TaxID=1867241 RepID=UPI003B6701D7